MEPHSRDPVFPDPRALDSLTAKACSMLLPRSYAASTLLIVFHGASGEPVGVRRTMRGACKGSKAQSEHCSLSFSAHNRPYLMTMAAAASKQGTILGRLWKALLLSRSKRLKENKKLMKRPKRAKKKGKRKRGKLPPVFFGKTAFHLGTIGKHNIHFIFKPPPLKVPGKRRTRRSNGVSS